MMFWCVVCDGVFVFVFGVVVGDCVGVFECVFVWCVSVLSDVCDVFEVVVVWCDCVSVVCGVIDVGDVVVVCVCDGDGIVI